MTEADQIISYKVPVTKVSCLICLDQGLIAVIHHNFSYSIYRLTLPKSQILGFGSMPSLSTDIQRFSKQKLVYVIDNKLQVYSWVQKQVVFSTSINMSKIYQNSFHYFQSETHFVFWKQSSLKRHSNYTYDVEIFEKNTLSHVRKYRFQYNHVSKIAFIYKFQNLALVVFPIRGFTIKVQYPDLNISHQIKSIYHLLHISTVQIDSGLELRFTHNQLSPQTVLCYQITPDFLKKYYKIVDKPNQIPFNSYYTLVLPDLIQNYTDSFCQIQVRIIYRKKLKLLRLLEQLWKQKCGIQEISSGLAKNFFQITQD